MWLTRRHLTLVTGFVIVALVLACTPDRRSEDLTVHADDPTTTGDPLAPSSLEPTTVAPTVTEPPLSADDDGDGLVKIILWGDSLAYQARDVFLSGFATQPKVVAESRTYGGTAICNYFSEYERRSGEVEVALLAFSGNAEWTCMVDPRTGVAPTGDAVVARYEADVERAIATLTAGGALVVLVGAPDIGANGPSNERRLVREMYRRVADRHADVTFVDAGAAVQAAGGYTDTLPCLPFEDESLGCRPDGRIVVRAPDGVHLCPNSHPTDPVLGRCDVWSSGAYRYGMAMTAAALTAAGLPDPRIAAAAGAR